MIVALVDDDNKERSTTMSYLIQGFKDAGLPIAHLDVFLDGESFLKSWKLGSYDLIVLDIIMKNISGIDVAREIRKHNKDVRIVFCSISNEYAYESYNVNASYYIQKPLSSDKVSDMIDRLNIADFELRRFVVIPDGQRIILRNIIYTNYCNHNIEIHMKSGNSTYIRMSQGQFESILSPYTFLICCSKGIMVNLHEVIEFKDNMFIMIDKTQVPVSRRKAKEAKEAYEDLLFHLIRKDLI